MNEREKNMLEASLIMLSVDMLLLVGGIILVIVLYRNLKKGEKL